MWAAARPLGFWPAGKLRLAGFTYDGFGDPAQATLKQRLDWIRSQYENQPSINTAAPFTTQPYRQLSNVYRQAGQEDEARAVEIAMRRDTRKYGILVLYVVVLLAFLAAQHQGSLIAASNVNNPALHPTAMQCVTGYPCFYPAGLAFDTVVPII